MKETRLQNIFLGIIVVFLAGMFLRIAKPILFPFFLAVLISVFQAPILDFFQRLKIPKFVSIIIILIVTVVALYLLGLLSYSTGKAFVSAFPKYSEKVLVLLEGIQKTFRLSPEQWNPQELVNGLNVSKIGSMVLSALGPFLSFLGKIILVSIFLIFILAGRGKMRQKIAKHIPEPQSSQVIKVIDNIDQEIQKYLAVKTIISIVTGFLIAAVLFVFHVDFALVFGFLGFILNYIPQIGSFIATLLPSLFALIQFPTAWPALWVLVIIFGIQTVMGNFVEPRMMGKGLDLSPLVVLFSLFFWAWLWGLEGMVLAIPLTSGIKIVFRNIPSLSFIAVLLRKE